jgi:TonB family protein
MPRALSSLTADYPAGAEGDAVVTVKLVVEKDGSVASVVLVLGKEPFSSAALAAARGFRFVPAKRDGVPIRAAVRAEVIFTAPRAAPAPDNPPGSPAPPSPEGPLPADTLPRNTVSPDTASPGNPPGSSPVTPPASPGVEPIDVSVKGIVAPPGATSLSRAEVRLLPGAFGDPFRAIEALPGVTPIASGIPYFFVRGAPPGNVGYFLDGIRVPLLYHLGLGPSVVHPAIVDRVDLYSGGYPAQFGRFAGAIVSGETRLPRPDINGEAQVRLVDAGAMLEAPFDGGRGSALVGGRYSYTGLLFSIFQQNLRLDYWDYQARVSYDTSPTDTVTLFAFGARDFLGDKDDTGKDRTLVDTTFHRLDLRYDRRLGPGSSFRNALTFGFDQTGFDGGLVRDTLLATRSELRFLVSPFLTFRAGTDATIDIVQTSLQLTDFGADIPIEVSNRADFTGGVWADTVLQVTNRFEVTPGLRVDLYGSTGGNGGAALSIEPRLSAVLHVSEWLRLVQAHGFAGQKPSFFLPGPGFSPDFTGGLQRTFQMSAGIEADVPLDIEAKLVFFRNAFFNMTDAFGTSTFTDVVTPEGFSQRSLGSSIGLELSLRRRMTKRIGGFVSYTLSQSERMLGKYHILSGTNRTHVLNTAVGVDIGRGFRAGTRVVFYTGFPRVGCAATPGSPATAAGSELPPFFRLDGRVEKRWTLGNTRWLSLVLEMQNTTLSKETLGGRCETVEIGPVAIPSIGLEGGL